ncbi:SMC family ATPase [Marihabitans asiaticum]|uniref:Nuclease SbcCD subunit C n=1 Tax=Marihabitans asiaticum TaxID=415218 RepID=A0A560W6L5_9MICO|nr:SMC family ATPase [Marihabitans asiaticum]TWD13262.1 exonuclease SbcC [Marihabitans asiaticum]
MRLHHLQVEAFGPFAERQRVDLEALGDAGLFLISGPTGAGKTSLLDAVSFALFGRVPGHRPVKQLKSQHADDAAVPRVVLEATLAGRRLRIERTAAFERPGRKTPVQASIVLDESVGGEWSTVARRLDEAGRVLEDVLGMTAEQFHRVVVLPQGDFAAFLHATNDDRESLLRRLFDVATYSDIEAWLLEERRRLDELGTQRAARLSSVRAALRRTLEDWTSTSAPPVGEAPLTSDCSWVDDTRGARDLLARTAPLHGAVISAENDALAAADHAETTHQQASVELARGRAEAADRSRGERARATLAALADDEPLIEQARRRLDAASRADQVHVARAPMRRARAELETQVRRGDLAAEQVPAHLRDLDDLDAVRAVTAELDAGEAGLEEMDRARDELESGAQRGQELRRRAQRTSGSVEQTAARLQELRGRRSELGATLDRATLATTALLDLQRSRPELDRRLRERTRLELLCEELLPRAEEQERTAHTAALDARHTYLDALQRRLEGMAAELAAGLELAHPCPVCGSAEHPAPASSSHEAVDADTLAATDERRRRTHEEHTQATGRRDALLQERDQLSEAVQGDERTAAELQAASTALEEEIEARSAEIAQAEHARAELTTLDEQVEHTTQQLDALRAETASAGALLEQHEVEQAARVTSLGSALEDHAGCRCGPPSPPECREDATDDELLSQDAPPHRAVAELGTLARRHREHHEAVRGRVDALLSATTAAAEAEAILQTATADLEDAARQHGFDDAGHAEQSRLAEQELSDLRTRVRTHDDATAAAQHVLAEPAVEQSLQGEAPDLAAAQRAEASARGELRRAGGHHEAVRQLGTALRRCRDDLADLAESEAVEDGRRDVVTGLAELASGRGPDNVDGISLTTYVLAARLHRITELANERLGSMADARFELVVDHGRSDRRRRGGLGLDVLDHWTGEARPATTLSGGETFMVSLALALGTADAVREESGGSEVHSLFIDEGFGSLDDDALEQVMTVLDELRSGGRAVGVISHVADMRTRIPAQLRIERTRAGSTVEIEAVVAAV